MSGFNRFWPSILLLLPIISHSAGDDRSNLTDESYCELDKFEPTQEVVPIKKELVAHPTIKRLKMALDSAASWNDIPMVAAIYLISKTSNTTRIPNAVATGLSLGLCIVGAPFTYGLTMIAGVPFGMCCVMGSIEAHRLKKIKRAAKIHLQQNLSPELFDKIISLPQHSGLAKLADVLREDGYLVTSKEVAQFTSLQRIIDKMQ